MSNDVKVEDLATEYDGALESRGVPEHIRTALRGEMAKYVDATRYGYALAPSTAVSLAARNAYGVNINGTQAGLDILTVISTYMRRVAA